MLEPTTMLQNPAELDVRRRRSLYDPDRGSMTLFLFLLAVLFVVFAGAWMAV